MSSLIFTMIMGTPTLNRRPQVAAALLSTVLLGIGLTLSSSNLPSMRYLGWSLLGAICLLGWQRYRQMHLAWRQALSAQQAWQAWMAASLDGVTVISPRRDLLGRITGHAVVDANTRAQDLFHAQGDHTLVGRTLEDLLPTALHTSLHQRVLVALASGRPQCEEHTLHQRGPGQPDRWLHHQIIPMGDRVALVSRDTTEAHLSIQALHEREAFYRTLVDCLPMAVYARSTRPSSAGEYVVWNKATAEVTQLSAEQVLGRKARELLPAEVIRRGDEQDLCVLRDPRVHHFNNLVYQTPRGERIVDLIKAPVYGVDGQVDHILAIAQDVTGQRQAADQLKMASRVIEETGDAVVVTDAVDRVVMVNPAFLNLTGMSPSEALGQSAELMGLPPLRESHLPGIAQALRSGQRWSGESRQICQDGRELDTWMSVSTLRNELHKVTQHIRVFSDISVLKAHQRELVEQARHDSLTGLPNRRAFGERLKQAVARARRNPAALVVVYVDLDGFKAVNDRHGHAAGDQLLVEVAKRLLQCVRLTDCVCRLSGDEFTVILEGAGDTAEVRHICQRILDRLCIPHEIGASSLVVSPSIGAAIYEAGEDIDVTCQRADSAMYAAKHAGKAGFVLSQPSALPTAPLLLRQGTN